MNLVEKAKDYGDRLDWYIAQKRLPTQWFASPEYITLATADIAEFADLVKRPEKQRVIRMPEEDDRFVVAAKLAGAFGMGKLGHISWIKIEELPETPRLTSPIRLMDVDFFVPDFNQARYFLGARGIEHETIEQNEHSQINVQFDSEGNTFCLLSKPIEVFMGEMVLSDLAQELKLDQAA